MHTHSLECSVISSLHRKTGRLQDRQCHSLLVMRCFNVNVFAAGVDSLRLVVHV